MDFASNPMTAAISLAQVPRSGSADAFWAAVGKLEHERLDFKVKPDGLSETIPAMAMTDGGLIVLGASNRREIQGCPLTQAVRDGVHNAGHNCGVEVGLTEIDVEGVQLVVVEVPEVTGRIVTTPNGRLLHRVGSQSVPLVGDSLTRFVMDRIGHVAEDDVIRDDQLWSDLDLDVVNRALGSAGRPNLADRSELPEALADLGVAEHDASGVSRPLKAAAILFARDPRRWIAGAAVQLIRRAGVGPGPGVTLLRREIAGPLGAVATEAIRLIEANTGHFETVIRTHREALPEYPHVALREAVLNALAHRDYGLAGTTVDITIWDDRVEIRSPGKLPGHITIENIRDQHYSRNRRVMRGLKLLGLVEEYGEGVDRMIEAMERRLMDVPTFAQAAASFIVTIRSRSLLSPEEQVWFALLGHLELTSNERRLLAVVKREHAATPRRLRTMMPGIDVDTLVKAAVTKGLLWRVGQRGGTRYVLSFEMAMRGGEVEVRGETVATTQPTAALELRTRQRQMLLDEVRGRGSLTVRDATNLLPNERPQVTRDLLDDLVRSGLLSTAGRTRGRRYVLPNS